jgi:uncharacterized repeat protein (TIGR01451 family)
MADTTLTKGEIVFDNGSQSRLSKPIKISGTMSFTAFGLQDDDEITFELLQLRESTPADDECCDDGCAGSVKMPNVVVVSATPLLCCGCSCEGLSQFPRSLNKKNPRIFFDDLDGLTIRAVWNNDGSGFGTATVLSGQVSNMTLTDAMRGCCGPKQADLQVIKETALPRYKVGEAFSYTMRFLNAGPSDASGAIIKDVLPKELDVTSITVAYGNGAMGAPTLTEAQLANYVIPTYPNGGYMDITVNGSYSKEGAYLNTATITAPDGVRDPDLSNNVDDVLINIDPLQPKLEITKTVSNKSPIVGDTGSYTITVKNSGVDTDTNIVLTDALPTGLAYVEPFTVTNIGAIGVPASVTAAQLAAGAQIASSMPAGSTITVVIPYTVTSATTIANTADVKGALGSGTATVVLGSTLPQADLKAVNKAVSNAKPVVGETITYTGSFINNGPQAANGAIVKDSPSSNITITSPITLVYGGGASGAATITAAQFVTGYAVPTMPNGGTVAFSYTATVNVGSEGQLILNIIGITPPAGVVDPNLLDNTKNVQANVQQKPETVYQSCGEDVTPATNLLSDKSFTVCKDGVEVPFQCGMKLKAVTDCCETNVATGPMVFGITASGCLIGSGLTPDSFGRIIYRGRDDVLLKGSGIYGNTPQYFQITITNPFNCPSLLEATLRTTSLSFKSPNTNNGEVTTFIYGLGEDLNENPPAYGSPASLTTTTSWVRNQVNINADDNAANNTAVGNDLFGNNLGGHASQTAAPLFFRKILAAGQSVTLYGQFIIVLNDVDTNAYYSQHAGFTNDSFWKITKGVQL